MTWLPQLDASTVVLTQSPDVFANAKIMRLSPTYAQRGAEGEYWLVNNSHGRLRLVLIDGASPTDPAAVIVPLDADFPARAAAAARLWRIAMSRPARRSSDSISSQRRQRLALILRALDAHQGGETYRDIARALFGARRIPAGSAWKTHDVRDRTIRLVRTGLRLMRGGYLDLLRHPQRR
jgi:hypothetical protein